MKKILPALLIFAVLNISCSGDNAVSVPELSGVGLLSQSLPLDDNIKPLLNGIYSIEKGSDNFGKTVAGKWSGNTFTVFTGKNFAYFVLKGGRIDSNIVLEGYWRFAQDVKTGLIQIEINSDEGGSSILRGNATSIIMRGKYGDGSSTPGTDLEIKYVRPLPQPSKPFWIVAHRGGGRNSDGLPESENSLGLISIAEQFGANALELDVRLTKDNVPIIFHDENLSPRLITGEYCVGPIVNYTYAQLRVLCTLKNGEPIPKLTEALETVITKTNLSLVWMDMKDPSAVSPAIEIQREYIQKAAMAGRSVEFLIGMPTSEALNKYLANSSHATAPSLCELSLNDVRRTNAVVWGPAWTIGPVTSDVNTMHSEGRRVFFWTLDGPEYIRVFLNEAALDGIVTNYPSIVAYEYYLH